MVKTRSFWLKFFEVFCMLFVIIGLLQFWNKMSEWEYEFVSNKIKLLSAISVMIAISVVAAVPWQKSNKARGLHKWFLSIIIFYVAYAISTYGFAKLMRTQFQPPQYILDTPVGDLSGFWLTWVYYGHSQTLAFILGIMQIAGSILLLFRKTRLGGVFILLPVMINIDLINHFYAISPLAYFNSAHYTFILLFLLFLDYDKLMAVFHFDESIIINRKSILLNIVRVAVIAFAFLNIFFLKQGISLKTKLNGEWVVKSVTKNNRVIASTDYQDSVWSKLYFEWRYGCLFKYDANKFEDKDLYGAYNINEKKHTILTTLYSNDKPDSVLFHYQLLNDSLMNMYGKYHKDSIILKLKKVKLKPVAL